MAVQPFIFGRNERDTLIDAGTDAPERGCKRLRSEAGASEQFFYFLRLQTGGRAFSAGRACERHLHVPRVK
jgi:hypothetical protein